MHTHACVEGETGSWNRWDVREELEAHTKLTDWTFLELWFLQGLLVKNCQKSKYVIFVMYFSKFSKQRQRVNTVSFKIWNSVHNWHWREVFNNHSDTLLFWRKIEFGARVTVAFERASHIYELRKLLLLKRQNNQRWWNRHHHPIISTSVIEIKNISLINYLTGNLTLFSICYLSPFWLFFFFLTGSKGLGA